MQEAKIFKNGQSQAVRIPKEFRFSGEKVLIERSGDCVILRPFKDSYESLITSLDMFSNDFMDERNQPQKQQVREAL